MSRVPYANEKRWNARRNFIRTNLKGTSSAETESPIALYSIAGNIEDAVAAPLENVVVTVYREVGKTNAVATTTTDSNGDFSLPAGFLDQTSYYVEAVLAGYTADNDPLTVAINGENYSTADFVLTAA